jgi:hypothetical protein
MKITPPIETPTPMELPRIDPPAPVVIPVVKKKPVPIIPDDDEIFRVEPIGQVAPEPPPPVLKPVNFKVEEAQKTILEFVQLLKFLGSVNAKMVLRNVTLEAKLKYTLEEAGESFKKRLFAEKDFVAMTDWFKGFMKGLGPAFQEAEED